MMPARLFTPQTTPKARWIIALKAPLAALSCVVTLALAQGVSFAQEVESVEDPLSPLSLSLTPSDVALNIDTCSEVAEETEFTLTGEYTGGVGPFSLRLMATQEGSCTNEDTCNEVPLDDGQCSCLLSRKDLEPSETITRRFKVRDLFEEPCVEGEEHVVSFFLHYRQDSQASLGTLGSQEVLDESGAVKLDIDLKAPSDPSEPPAV